MPEFGQNRAAQLARRRAGMVVSRLQGRLALGQDTCVTLDAIAADPLTPWPMREAILTATRWERTSQTIDELGYLLGYTPEQMDALFDQAAKVRV